MCKFWLQGAFHSVGILMILMKAETLLRTGYCHRGESCFYTHDDGGRADKELAEALSCAICFEVPQKFGLLGESRCPPSTVHSLIARGCRHLLAHLLLYVHKRVARIEEGGPSKGQARGDGL